jgi:antitoxin YefM
LEGEKIMITGIRQKTIVKEDGKIEILSSGLPPGVTVEVIVFVDSEEQDTTEYLLSKEANRKHLYQALKDLEDRSTYTYVNPADL